MNDQKKSNRTEQSNHKIKCSRLLCYTCCMASLTRDDHELISPYQKLQLEAGRLPREFLVALFLYVCIRSHPDRGVTRRELI